MKTAHRLLPLLPLLLLLAGCRGSTEAAGVIGIVGGSDGATLFAFERALRSTNGGDTFTTVDVPLVGGARAYGSGFVRSR